MSGWLVATFFFGLMAGVVLCVATSNSLDEQRIAAGAFQFRGEAYRITPLEKASPSTRTPIMSKH